MSCEVLQEKFPEVQIRRYVDRVQLLTMEHIKIEAKKGEKLSFDWRIFYGVSSVKH
ncbi:hypothetical protein AAJCM20276_29610 [Acetobacter aceti]|uniref:Uncharacterized protein n=1 Tax=Acetobacter aceti TaxID=435 RepID=A0A6S6PH41_ACEAC|nr:hypothetical protein AAJCM20276_29610 [Acetobacter aceti]